MYKEHIYTYTYLCVSSYTSESVCIMYACLYVGTHGTCIHTYSYMSLCMCVMLHYAIVITLCYINIMRLHSFNYVVLHYANLLYAYIITLC